MTDETLIGGDDRDPFAALRAQMQEQQDRQRLELEAAETQLHNLIARLDDDDLALISRLCQAPKGTIRIVAGIMVAEQYRRHLLKAVDDALPT